MAKVMEGWEEIKKSVTLSELAVVPIFSAPDFQTQITLKNSQKCEQETI